MAFAGSEDAIATTEMHKTLKLLHETIQTQTIATDKQSNIMIKLTRYLLGFTIVLCFLGIIQTAIFIQNLNTTTHKIQTYHLNQQIPTENKPIEDTQALPPIIKGENERHK